jgi:hypothetical protein
VEFLLRGIYSAIRNPRSHEKRSDSVDTADVIISFVDFLVGLIDKSKSPFDSEEIIGRIFDKHFAQTSKYADLLVCKIPQRKRLDILLQVFRRRTEGNGSSLSLFTQAVLATLELSEQAVFWEAVSEALESAQSDADYRSAVQIAEPSWMSVSEIARIRTENRLIQSIEEGRYSDQTGRCLNGGLGTWARGIANHFVMQGELVSALIARMDSQDSSAREYVYKYFLALLHDLRPTPSAWLVMVLRRRLQEQDQAAYEALSFLKVGFTDELDQSDKWSQALGDAYLSFRTQTISGEITDEDIPF